MFFRQILHEEKSCLSYVVGCPSQGVCAVIDAQEDPEIYINLAERYGLKITDVIETHIQADHISVSRRLAEIVNAKLYFGPKAKVNFPFQELNDGMELSIGRRVINAIHTPGHTSEHICLLVDDWLVITGDTLFVGDVGRVDLIDSMDEKLINSRATSLHESIKKLLALPDITEIYPGHYRGSVCGKGIDSKPSSTIGRERQKNPVLQLDLNEFIKYLSDDMPKLPANFHQIKQKNSGK
jgi:hydroxyacylglutathione hydrolase